MVLLPERGSLAWKSRLALENEEAGLVFSAISTVKSVLKTKKIKSFKLFLTLDTKLSEEEDSNDDS